jgi:hypothetical protein
MAGSVIGGQFNGSKNAASMGSRAGGGKQIEAVQIHPLRGDCP